MRCPNCGYENRSGARFCGRCGQPTVVLSEVEGEARACPECGREVRRGASFCPHCGTRLLFDGPRLPGDGPRLPGESEAGAKARSEPPVPAYTPPPASQPSAGYAAPPYRQADVARQYQERSSTQRRRPAWALGLISVVLSSIVMLCVVLAVAMAPAFSEEVPPLPEVDPEQPDITILVQEAYISDMLGEALPQGVEGEAVMDVRPGNELVTTIDFKLLIVRLTVVVNAGIAVEDGEVAVWVDSVEAGGRDVLGLVGVDQIALGEDITGQIQEGLEEELGEDARLLTIVTDETHVILTARWE